MRIFLTLIVAFVVGFPPLGHARDVLRIVADEWAPFGGQDLPNQGLSIDVITSVLTRAGYRVETEIVPWERALQGARDGRYDIVGNIFLDASLEEFLGFSMPFYSTDMRFVRHVDFDFAFSGLESLEFHAIAVGAGYLYEQGFDQSEDLNKIEVTTVLQSVRMVATQRVALTLDSEDVLRHAIGQLEPELAEQLRLVDTPLTTRALRMAVRRNLTGGDQVIQDFNRVLAEMQADGSLANVLAKHRR